MWPFKWKLLIITFLCCFLSCCTWWFSLFQILESVDEILWSVHSHKSYWVVLTCGAVFYAAHGSSNFSSLWTIILKCDHSESCLAVLSDVSILIKLWIQNGKEYWFLISLSFSLRRALAMFNYEERSKRENKILSDFREMIHQKINNKKWTVNHNFPFVHLLSSPILHYYYYCYYYYYYYYYYFNLSMTANS